MRFLGQTFALTLLCFTAQSVAADEPAAKIKKALFIGIDGVRFDALEAAETPQLDQLLKNGIYSDRCMILGIRFRRNDTVSGPGWSSILTGVWADKHGVLDNTFKGGKFKDYPHFFTHLKSQRPEANTVSIVTWKPIDKFIVSGADKQVAIEGEPKKYDESDKKGTEQAVEVVKNPKLDCLFHYFGQVDAAGHQHGFHPTVPEYVKAIENVDAGIGGVLAAIRARPTYGQEDWLIVVTSDHGGSGQNHNKGHKNPWILNTILIVSGDAAHRGKFAGQTHIVDAPVTVLKHLGVSIDPNWKLDGRPRGLKQ